jgi:glycosyltransferase involved in cell wall biosynthesis
MPVYNGADHLAEAIESVLSQTYSAWELVVLDNRSTDDTAEIGRAYSARDPRVSVITADTFVPVIQNWNRALANATPGVRYIKFLHADDWLYPRCLEEMVGVAERHPAVGIVCGYRLDGDRVNLDGLPPDLERVAGREAARRLLLGEWPFIFGSPTSTLLRAEVVRRRDPFYDETVLHADTEAAYWMLTQGDIGFVPQVLTYTRRHDRSVTTFAARVGTYRPEELEFLHRYGPAVLEHGEYERRMVRLLLAYGATLLSQTPRFRHSEFRNYHRRAARQLLSWIEPGAVGRGLLRQSTRTIRSVRTRQRGSA